jgi:hypothetical protein
MQFLTSTSVLWDLQFASAQMSESYSSDYEDHLSSGMKWHAVCYIITNIS